MTTSAAFSTRYNIDIRTFSEVTGIDRQGKAVEVRNLLTGETYRETYDKLILSPGAEPILPPIEGIDGENVFRLRTIPDADRIKARVESGNPGSAVIVGGGFIGIEMAENLVQRGVKTTILEKLDQILPPLDPEMAAIVQDALEEQGVVCELGNGLKAITRKGDRLAVEQRRAFP